MTEQAVQILVTLCASESESEFVAERVSAFVSAFVPECWFVCGCELATSVCFGAVEMEGHL